MCTYAFGGISECVYVCVWRCLCMCVCIHLGVSLHVRMCLGGRDGGRRRRGVAHRQDGRLSPQARAGADFQQAIWKG